MVLYRIIFVNFFITFIAGKLEETSVNLTSVLTFFTGTNRVPPLGFHQKPRLYFVHDSTASLAIASTCDLSL